MNNGHIRKMSTIGILDTLKICPEIGILDTLKICPDVPNIGHIMDMSLNGGGIKVRSREKFSISLSKARDRSTHKTVG